MFKDLKGFVGYVDKNDISAYIRKKQKFPILSHEDESRLATEWINNKTDKAAHALINSHLRLVVKIAMKFRGYGLQLSELVSEGNLGLIQSLERFDLIIFSDISHLSSLLVPKTIAPSYKHSIDLCNLVKSPSLSEGGLKVSGFGIAFSVPALVVLTLYVSLLNVL